MSARFTSVTDASFPEGLLLGYNLGFSCRPYFNTAAQHNVIVRLRATFVFVSVEEPQASLLTQVSLFKPFYGSH